MENLDHVPSSHYQRISYRSLNARQKETYNFQKVSGILADFGFTCIKLSDDWNGADFLACHFDGIVTLRVQLKSRLHISKKYQGKELHLCFPFREMWFLIPHDDLVTLIASHTPYLQSKSWKEDGTYTSSPSKALLPDLEPFKIHPH